MPASDSIPGAARQPLSVVIIARDEGDRIEAAIRSVPFAQEVVVVDSGSRDDTVARARAAGARVVETDWPGHVAQKNRAWSLALHPWVLSIDADERVGPELAVELEAALAEPGDRVGFTMPRLSWWAGAPLGHGTWHPDRRLRLARKDRARWTGRDPHDLLEVDGPVGLLAHPLLHDPYRNLGEHLSTIDRYSAEQARGALDRGERGRLVDVLLRPHLHIVKALLLRAGFRDGVRGVVVATLGGGSVLLKWSRIYLGARGVSREWLGIPGGAAPGSSPAPSTPPTSSETP